MDLYYALWAGMLDWPVGVRAIVVLAAVMFLCWLALVVIKFIVSLFLGVAGKGFVKIYFSFRQLIASVRRRALQQDEWIQYMNRIASHCSALDDKRGRAKAVLRKGNKKLFLACLAVYALSVFLIGIPTVLEHVIDAQYMKGFYFARDIYCSLEKSTLENAENYAPLFISGREEASPGQSEAKGENDIADEEEEIKWYILSEAGESGANLRLGPGTEYEVIEVLAGSVRMHYMEETERWIYVELEEGQKGWINKNLVKEED